MFQTTTAQPTELETTTVETKLHCAKIYTLVVLTVWSPQWLRPLGWEAQVSTMVMWWSPPW